ncbi:hybrid sensor histidine kinase/response regulator [Spirulina subsalsa]|uniref:hybrid sensor histidine kinase/response regulator n=1 Tax=Spirulina subsalsa TaxID=54311 RepID=UPI000309FC13|nr:hybrid sensor histidine kinase/response regulator [Spirulina subsalsa]
MSFFRLEPTPAVNKILVVDDSPDNLFLIQSILEEEGYESELAENGQDAIALIEENPPDLVLLDVMMPGMDGFEVTRRIRENPHLSYIPILLITAYDQASVVQGLDSGADDFIRKPVEIEELLARVRSLLRLKQSVDERDAIARQREDFVSRLTHDLRTPLVAADRMLDLFQQGAFGDLPSEMQEAVSIMIRSNQNLLALVNTLLDVYRYEAGRKRLNITPLHLPQIILEVIEELTPLATEKGLSLSYHPTTETFPTVSGDALELRRVLINIIGNAIKFTDQGGVKIALHHTPQHVKIAVQDTGQGISPDEQKNLFQRFRQGDHTRAGSGLGLHLSQCIIAAHHGHITVDSEPGKGSTFTITLTL